MVTRREIVSRLRDGLLHEGTPVIIDREMARAILEKYEGIVSKLIAPITIRMHGAGT